MNNTSTIYLVFNGFYDDRRVIMATLNKDKALKKLNDDGTYIEIWQEDNKVYDLELFPENKKEYTSEEIIKLLEKY